MLRFLYYYVRSMRLYYGFVTATTVLAGLYRWHRFPAISDAGPFGWSLRDAALLAMGFLAWGFNQIFSDWCDRKEDAINAPHRPMVTGALALRPALVLSFAGLAVLAITGFLMSPWTLAFLALGGALNVAYSLLKRVPVLNCLVYACAISCCALFAVAGIAGRCPNAQELGFVAAWILPVHFLMCHNSYYKDVAGDRVAGVRTLQTLCPAAAKVVSAVMAGIAVALMSFVAVSNLFCLPFALLLALLAVAFQIAVLRASFHRATCLNCQLCVLMLHMPFAEAWGNALVSLVAIQLLFLWYNDEKE